MPDSLDEYRPTARFIVFDPTSNCVWGTGYTKQDAYIHAGFELEGRPYANIVQPNLQCMPCQEQDWRHWHMRTDWRIENGVAVR